MSDLISRQDAVKALYDYWTGCSFDGDGYDIADRSEDVINDLPSVEPKTPSNGSITCVRSEKMHVRPTGDLISRQDAIDAILGLTNCDTTEKLRAHVKAHDLGSWWSGGVLSSIGKVERLPSAEKTQLSGKDATSVCKCPCEYREPCDYCPYRRRGCPAEEGLKDE